MKEIDYGTQMLKASQFKSEKEALEFANTPLQWQEVFTDEEYIKKFGHPKRNITNFRKAYVRRIPRWFSYNTNCGTEWDCQAVYFECEKGGRGATEYYLYEDTYGEDDWWKNELKKDVERNKKNDFERLAEEDDNKKIL